MQALEKISHEHPAACLRHGGLLASLSYLDFFQTGVQRVAVATAANMCRCVTSEHTEAVASAIPMLTNLLQYQVSMLERLSVHLLHAVLDCRPDPGWLASQGLLGSHTSHCSP